ncbi:MAG: hypothetical protein V4733_12490 [Verrucomicrobiota bacterium]
MNHLLQWLLLLCLFLGLQVRTFAEDPCATHLKSHIAGNCDHQHSDNEPCHSHHDSDCPHGHLPGACAHTLPFAADLSRPPHCFSPGFSLTLIFAEHLAAPDDPCLEMDKPPIV